MRKLTYISLFLLVIALTACQSESSPKATQRVEIPDHYALNLPEGFVPSYDLHDFASLQYADNDRNWYLIGLEESKRSLRNIHLYYQLDEYAWFSHRSIAEGLDTVFASLQYPAETGGLECVMVQMEGQQWKGQEPVDLYYQMAIYETDQYFYQLIGWCAAEDQNQLSESLKDVFCSFEELPHQELLTDETFPETEDFPIHPKAEI